MRALTFGRFVNESDDDVMMSQVQSIESSSARSFHSILLQPYGCVLRHPCMKVLGTTIKNWIASSAIEVALDIQSEMSIDIVDSKNNGKIMKCICNNMVDAYLESMTLGFPHYSLLIFIMYAYRSALKLIAECKNNIYSNW